MSKENLTELAQTNNEPEGDVSLAWSDPSVIRFSESEFESLSSKRAGEIANFEDTVDIGSKTDLSVDIRSQRGNAPTLVPIGEFEVVPGINPRLPTPEWTAHIRWIADQIKKEGFRADKPIYAFVTGNKKVGIIDGESRYHAVKLAISEGADIKSLPTIFAQDGLSIEEMVVQLATSNSGKVFTPIEMAMLAQRFTKWGRTPTEIASILKVTTSYVLQLLTIAKAPHAVRSMITNGEVSMQVALAALKEGPAAATKKLTEAVSNAKESGTTKVTAKHMPEYQAQKAAKAFAPQMQSIMNKLRDNEGLFAMLEDDIRAEIEDVLLKISDMMNAKSAGEEGKAKSKKSKSKEVNLDDIEQNTDEQEESTLKEKQSNKAHGKKKSKKTEKAQTPKVTLAEIAILNDKANDAITAAIERGTTKKSPNTELDEIF